MTYRGSCDLCTHASAIDTTHLPRKITSWARSERSILLIEGYPAINYSPTIGPYNQDECFRFGMLSNMARGRHNPSWHRHVGTTNLLFMDGQISHHSPRDVGRIVARQEHRL